MKLAYKLLIATCVTPLLIWMVGIRLSRVAEESLRDSIESAAVNEVVAIHDEIDRLILNRVANWLAYTRSSLVQETLSRSNHEFSDLPDVEAYLSSQDRKWANPEALESYEAIRQIYRAPLSRDLRATLRKLNETSGLPVFGEVFVTNAFGGNVAQSGPTSDYRQSDEPWWQEAYRTGIFVGDVTFDDSADIYCIEICPRIDDEEGNPLGVLKAVMNIQDIVQIIDSRAASSKGVTTLGLLTMNGSVIRIGNSEEPPLSDGSHFLEGAQFENQDQVTTLSSQDAESGDRIVTVYAKSSQDGTIQDLGWIVMQRFREDYMLAPLHELRQQLKRISFGAALMGLAIVGWIALPLSQRVARLTEATIAIGEGNLDTPVRSSGKDEIAGLTRAFDQMRTSLQESRDAMREARLSAERANRAKSDFLANISHEIRTPLNGILGMTELLLAGKPTPQQIEQLNIVHRSAETLLRLLNEILDFSKIEAGKMDLEQIPFPLRETLDNTLKIFSRAAAEKDLELVCEVAPELEDQLEGDPARLEQILLNLVGNAIKFTPEGDVIISIREEKREQDRLWLHFTVEDTGVGIPESKQALIFEEFSQADSSTTRQYGGTGLGLAISGRLVALMGGRIWLESTPSQGSCFHFVIPFPIPDSSDSPATQAAPELENLPVLLAESHPRTRAVLEQMLHTWGMNPIVTSNGEETLSTLHRDSEGIPPIRLLILDASLPDLDGFEILARLQGNKSFHSLPVLMLTPANQPGLIDRALELGVHHCLTKPVPHADLLAAISRTQGIETASPASVRELKQLPESARLRILLAEDGLVNQRVAAELLRQRGHLVTIVQNGREAVEVSGRESFDLVLMDLHMPEMDGFEATSRIRQRESGTENPLRIIAMTANARPEDRQRCLDAGMNGYLAKPIRSWELYQLVESGSMDAPEEIGTDGPHPEDSSLSDEEVLNLAVARKNIGSESLLQEMLTVYFEETPQLLQQIQASIDQEDAATLERAAHTLKSNAAMLHAEPVRKAARTLEDSGRQGDLARAEPLVEQLEAELARLDLELRSFQAEITGQTS